MIHSRQQLVVATLLSVAAINAKTSHHQHVKALLRERVQGNV